MQKSRQVQRAEFRAEVKIGESRRNCRAREGRQLALEKRKVPPSSLRMAATSKSRSRIHERKVQKGKSFGRVIIQQPAEDRYTREFYLHATKGWRSRKA